MNFSPANITALIVAASFAGGLNIYATVLTLGILERTQWVALPPGLHGLGSTWVIVTCALLFAMEFVADKIPGFDMIWNGLQTVVRVPVAGLVAYHASSQLSPQMQILATTIGAADCACGAWLEDGCARSGDSESGADLEYCAEYERGCAGDWSDVVRHASSDHCGDDGRDVVDCGVSCGTCIVAGDSEAVAEGVSA